MNFMWEGKGQAAPPGATRHQWVDAGFAPGGHISDPQNAIRRMQGLPPVTDAQVQAAVDATRRAPSMIPAAARPGTMPARPGTMPSAPRRGQPAAKERAWAKANPKKMARIKQRRGR